MKIETEGRRGMERDNEKDMRIERHRRKREGENTETERKRGDIEK